MHGGRAALAAIAAVCAAVLMLWAAGSGDPLLSAPTTSLEPQDSRLEAPEPPQLEAQPRTETPQEQVDSGSGIDWWLLLQAAVLGVLVWAVVRWFRSRAWSEPAEHAAVEPPDELAELVQATSPDDSSRPALAGEPRNAVVACWVALEEGLARAGLAPGPAETSLDLTRRVMHRWDVDPDTLSRLALLYREARFSRHPITSWHRDEAVAALGQIHVSLRRAAERVEEPR